VLTGDAKAFEVEDPKSSHHGLCSGIRVKVVIGQFSASAVTAEFTKAVGGRGRVGFPGGGDFFWKENFARINAFEGGKEVIASGFCGEEEFTGGEIEPSGVELVFLEVEGEEEMVALSFDLAV
jgi:hypothetical protein